MAAQKPKLVSVTFKKSWGRYAIGDRAGFDPEKAKWLVETKRAVESGKAGTESTQTQTKAATGNKSESANKNESHADKA